MGCHRVFETRHQRHDPSIDPHSDWTLKYCIFHHCVERGHGEARYLSDGQCRAILIDLLHNKFQLLQIIEGINGSIIQATSPQKKRTALAGTGHEVKIRFHISLSLVVILFQR